ncbi:MAG: hypothetical protein LIO65_06380 [Odoribacter sp.]|nr:hypothetical protein [Odoribacter sp.]
MTEIDHIIAKVLSGEATDAELLLFNQWMEADPENHHRFLQMRSYWRADVEFSHPISMDASFEKLSGKIRQQEADIRKKAQKQKLVYIGTAFAALAACLITFILVPKGLGGKRFSFIL